MATTPKDPKKAEAEAEKAKAEAGVPEATATDATIPIKGSLILSVTENGYGKRTSAGVRLLHMEPGDRVAAAAVIPLDEETNGGLLQ